MNRQNIDMMGSIFTEMVMEEAKKDKLAEYEANQKKGMFLFQQELKEIQTLRDDRIKL